MKVSLQISSCLWLLLFMHNWCQYHKEHVLGSKSQHLGNKDDGVNRRKGHRRESAPGQRFILTGQHKGKVIARDAHTLVSVHVYSELEIHGRSCTSFCNCSERFYNKKKLAALMKWSIIFILFERCYNQQLSYNCLRRLNQKAFFFLWIQVNVLF